MRLRGRLALTTVCVAVPVMLATLRFDAAFRHETARQDLRALTMRHMLADGERARCEADAAHWGGRPLPPPHSDHQRPKGPPPGPGVPGDHPGSAPPVLFAYDAGLHAQNPRAPTIHGEPAEALWPGPVVEVLVSMPWRSGPCANVLARGSTNPRWFGGLLPRAPLWALPVGFVLLALLLAVGPVVRRARRLAKAVSDSASAGFTHEVPIEGADEITDLARAFQAASREVQKQLAEKDGRERALREYVANTTHDLMIPLTVLKSYLTTIQERQAQGQQVDAATLAGAIGEAHYLGALVHNLGIAAKLDAAEPHIARAEVDMCALVERVLSRHRPLARQRGVSLDGAVPEAGLVVLGDVTLLEQAVNNIVHNGIRYNRSGGHVGVTLDKVGKGFRLRVVDDGPGIAAHQLELLSRRGFRSSEARTRAPEGQGLGLNIALRVAEALDMQLRFERPEQGGLLVDLTGAAAG